MARKFSPELWGRLVSEERRSLLNPDSFLEQIGVEPGSVVSDFGAGPGFFTMPLAEPVGPRGRVYALDVAPEMIRVLQDRDLPKNVQVKLSGENGLPLPDRSVDMALLAFVLHELDNPALFLNEVERVLKPTAKLVVLEWVPQEEEMGPPIQERIAEADSAGILVSSGFRIDSRGLANSSNYYLIAQPDGALPGTERSS